MLHSPSGNNVLSGPPKLIALDFQALPGSQATTSRLGRLTLSLCLKQQRMWSRERFVMKKQAQEHHLRSQGCGHESDLSWKK